MCLCVQLELLRLDYSEQPAVAQYLHALEHETDTAKAAELRRTEVGVRVTTLLQRFDQCRAKLVGQTCTLRWDDVMG
jgi:hypothetical protein